MISHTSLEQKNPPGAYREHFGPVMFTYTRQKDFVGANRTEAWGLECTCGFPIKTREVVLETTLCSCCGGNPFKVKKREELLS